MRLSAFPLLLAGASLVQYAAASPLRVVVVSSHVETLSPEQDPSSVRFKDARPITVPGAPPVPIFAPLDMFPQAQDGAGRHRGCSLKNKALNLSNKFREMFGLPPIAAEHHPVPENNFGVLPVVRPIPAIDRNRAPAGIPPRLPPGRGPIQILPVTPDGPMGHHRRPHFHRSFLHRVHRALMILGPWEGRAVAFVLGCGIGVLLRMFWVMTIVLFRAFRGGRSSEEADVHDVLVFEADAEDILVPPPQYTDEKVALAAPEPDSKVDTKA